MPSGLGITSSSAPKACIVCSFSGAKASEVTILSGYPLTAQTNASERCSRRVLDDRLARASAPDRSAPSIIGGPSGPCRSRSGWRTRA